MHFNKSLISLRNGCWTSVLFLLLQRIGFANLAVFLFSLVETANSMNFDAHIQFDCFLQPPAVLILKKCVKLYHLNGKFFSFHPKAHRVFVLSFPK